MMQVQARRFVLSLVIPLALLVACGPPKAVLQEQHSRTGRGEVDHSLLDQLLNKHVNSKNQVDYAGLHAHPKALDDYITLLAGVDFQALGRDQKLALLINAYNAFTLRLILDHYPLQSIEDIPAAKRWKAQRWHIGDLTLSLDSIEHQYLRSQFAEPRIHFAINCASIGCPPLRQEAYQAGQLEQQLQSQAMLVHNDHRWFQLEKKAHVLYLTRLYDWFGGDFKQAGGSVLAYAARFSLPLARTLEASTQPSIQWLDYDWSLNQVP